jgi:hypothetical protein
MFIHSAGAAGLGLTARLGMSEPGGSAPMLLKLLEDSPRERLPRELVGLIHSGLRHEDLLAALSLAATRNVQPYPDVGFKYHAVMMLRSVQATTRQMTAAEKWLPLVWAVDYFKDTQAQEQASSGWHMTPAPPAPAAADTNDKANAQAARRALIAALDKWDREAADAAIVQYARSAPPDEIFSVLFPYGARDMRDIGHKPITVSNAHSLMTLFGAEARAAQAEPILRSTVAALLNSEGQPNPATHDLMPDRPGRVNRERVQQIPRTWKQGHDDPGARVEFRAALYQVSPEDAGKVCVDMLRRGISPDAMWQVLFTTAAELLLHETGIVPLHAQTTANALHYVYRASDDERTQQLALLQCAAFVAMFRGMTNTAATAVNLTQLEAQPLERQAKQQPVEAIFADLSIRQRLLATRKSLGYLRDGGDADSLIAAARHHLVYGAVEAHDYKFAEAVFDNYAQFPDAEDWRTRFLSAGMAYFRAPAQHPVPIVAETLALLTA